MIQTKLNEILRLHKMWLNKEPGEKADLCDADLCGANLRGADLRDADLCGANLRHADLRGADLRGADLRGADLRYVDLRYADLRYVDLRDANLDFSAWPLWCGSLRIGKTDDKLVAQLLYHTLAVAKASDGPLAKKLLSLKTVKDIANTFHRAEECGKIE